MRGKRIPRLSLILAGLAVLAALPAEAATRSARQTVRPAKAKVQPARPKPRPVRAVAAKPVSRLPPAGPTASAAVLGPIVAELRAQAKGKLKTFYASRKHAPLWAASGSIGPEADALVAHLDSAALDGLRPSSYDPGDLRKDIAKARAGGPKEIARAELRLSQAFVRYSADLRKLPKRDPTGTIYADPSLVPRKVRGETLLRNAAIATSFPRYVTGMQWMSPHYLRMRFLLGQAIARRQPESDLARIRLNLERARRLPGPWTLHIVVDAGSARLWYYQAGQAAGEMRVVVGKTESQTPMMAGMVQWAVLNPYWNVPVDLAQKSIAIKVLKGNRLRSMRMEVLSDWSEGAKKVDPAKVDWRAVAAGTQEVRVRQLPGPGNSMGKVKFLFPNEMGIYLHDTSELELMAKPERHLSNGCIRLGDAPGLGAWLLGRPISGITTQLEHAVPLRVPVPVYLTYFTAVEGKEGTDFIDDVYRRDAPKVAVAGR